VIAVPFLKGLSTNNHRHLENPRVKGVLNAKVIVLVESVEILEKVFGSCEYNLETIRDIVPGRETMEMNRAGKLDLSVAAINPVMDFWQFPQPAGSLFSGQVPLGFCHQLIPDHKFPDGR